MVSWRTWVDERCDRRMVGLGSGDERRGVEGNFVVFIHSCLSGLLLVVFFDTQVTLSCRNNHS